MLKMEGNHLYGKEVSFFRSIARKTNKSCPIIDESTVPATPRRRPRSDSLENPFLVPFTPSKRMKVLRAGLASDSKTSYLVSSSPATGDMRIISPCREQPELFAEPSWNTLLNSNIGHMDAEELLHEAEKLRAGLRMARDCIRAREAVVESAHATNVVLELTCQRQRVALYRKETEKLQKKDKRSLFGDGKAHVVTDDDFIAALEEIEEAEKERDKDKERRKLARAEAKESKEVGKKAWERAVEEWKKGREEWQEECERLKKEGCRKKDLPGAPKRPKKADVLAAMLDEGGEDEEEGEGEGEEDDDEDGNDDNEDDDDNNDGEDDDEDDDNEDDDDDSA